jgi:hypothetical protein
MRVSNIWPACVCECEIRWMSLSSSLAMVSVGPLVAVCLPGFRCLARYAKDARELAADAGLSHQG